MTKYETPPQAGAPTPASNYDGFYFRNNLAFSGLLPTVGPYCQCPDIIGSTSLLNAEQVLSTPQSWQQLYDVSPVQGSTMFYYLRGKNSSTDAVQMAGSLYYAPASLLLHPEVWQHNLLMTVGGEKTVAIQASAGEIGVGGDPLVWQGATVPGQLSDFYSFVAQVSDEANSNPIPNISSWLDLGALIKQNLGFGFRTTNHVTGTGVGWCHWLGLSMPTGIANPGDLQLTVSANGLSGCTVSLLADTLLPNGMPLALGPQPISSNNFTTGLNVSFPSNYSASLAVLCTNPSGQPTGQSGATLTVTLSYPVPPNALTEAVDRRLIDNRSVRWIDSEVGIQPQPMILLGEATFVVI